MLICKGSDSRLVWASLLSSFAVQFFLRWIRGWIVSHTQGALPLPLHEVLLYSSPSTSIVSISIRAGPFGYTRSKQETSGWTHPGSCMGSYLTSLESWSGCRLILRSQPSRYAFMVSVCVVKRGEVKCSLVQSQSLLMNKTSIRFLFILGSYLSSRHDNRVRVHIENHKHCLTLSWRNTNYLMVILF